KNVRVMGEEIAVRAAIHEIDGYSAHADRQGLLEWLGALRGKPRALFLIHGEDDTLGRWSETVRRILRLTPVVPAAGETYLLADKAVLKGALPTAAPKDDWSVLMGEVEAAYRSLRTRLPGSVSGDPAVADRLRRQLRRVIKDMGKVS
ncbi:MAG: MBL fold metallo-hydrolase RNA specificity domain-containing protein, partial [Bacteroidota bacterium]